MIDSKIIINWALSKGLKVQSNFNFQNLIEKPWNINESIENNLSFITNGWKENNAGIVFSNTFQESFKGIIIVSETPKLDFVRCVRELFKPEPAKIISGKDVFIGENCSIGKDGFQYLRDGDKLVKFPHFGNVILEDEVEIGNNVSVARGALSNTILRKGVKTDNEIHIAHNVQIGENTMIAANAMIAGSAKIGKNCWLSPSCSIINQITIGDNCLIGIGAVVIKDVEPNSVMVGNPAKLLRKQ